MLTSCPKVSIAFLSIIGLLFAASFCFEAEAGGEVKGSETDARHVVNAKKPTRTPREIRIELCARGKVDRSHVT